MPLLLLALDDTLLDRAGAFRSWATDFLTNIGARHELDWLISIDAEGRTSPWDVADALRDRFRLRARAIDLVENLQEGLLSRMRLDPLVACALRIADESGWVPVVVSNGPTRLQEEKIRRTGLDRYIAEWVVSEEAGVSKPDPRIFAIAARRARMRLHGAWVVGESPQEDIGGAAAAGLPSVWLHRGRTWVEPRFGPTRMANGCIAAVAAAMDAGNSFVGAGMGRPPYRRRPDIIGPL